MPEETRRALADAGGALETGSEGFFGSDDGSLHSAILALRDKLGGLASDDVRAELVSLASSRLASGRLAAARVLRDLSNRPISPHLLLPLLGDENTLVALAAASAVATRASEAPDDPTLQQALIACLRAEGAGLAHMALGYINTKGDLPEDSVKAIRQSTTHESAAVRARAKKVLRQLGDTANGPVSMDG
jgi:HEAT repeat protein